MHILLQLFSSFFKIGLFTFGGGYAMLPLIERECVERKEWISYDEMMNVTVVAESTPGPIAINCATYIGYRQGKLPGAVAATVGVVLPSFCIISLLAAVLDRFLAIPLVVSAFKGIKVAVGILIVNAAVTMLRKMPRKALTYAIFFGSFAVMTLVNIFSWSFSSVALMLIAGAVSLTVFVLRGGGTGKGGAG